MARSQTETLNYVMKCQLRPQINLYPSCPSSQENLHFQHDLSFLHWKNLGVSSWDKPVWAFPITAACYAQAQVLRRGSEEYHTTAALCSCQSPRTPLIVTCSHYLIPRVTVFLSTFPVKAWLVGMKPHESLLILETFLIWLCLCAGGGGGGAGSVKQPQLEGSVSMRT